MMKEAPVYVRSYDLALWLHRRLADVKGHDALRLRLLQNGEDLVVQVSMALQGLERVECLRQADEHLVRLRIYARLASELEILSPSQLEHVTRQLDDIGRQIGGWRAKLSKL